MISTISASLRCPSRCFHGLLQQSNWYYFLRCRHPQFSISQQVLAFQNPHWSTLSPAENSDTPCCAKRISCTGICSPLEVHLSLRPPVCGPVTLTCLQSPERFLSSGLLRAPSYWGLFSFIMYYANDWKGTNIPHVSGWLMGPLHLFYSLILSYFIFNVFPHPVKVLRQGKQFSRQTPTVCLCLKAYSMTC